MTSRRTVVFEKLPALQSRDYRRLFLSTFFTAASRFALLLARAWLVFDLTGSSFAVGVVTFAAMAQNIIVGPLGGALADRVDRRVLILVGTVVAMSSSAVLAVITLTGIVEVWHVVVLAAVQGMAGAFTQPAQRALLANLVPKEHLLNAVALSGIAQHGSRFFGPLVGGALLYFFGAGYVFVLSAVILLATLVLIARIELRWSAPTSQQPANVRRLTSEIGEGFVHVRRDARLMLIIGLVAPHCACTMAFNAMLPRLATDLGGDERVFSAIVMGLGAGAIIGTLALSLVRQQAVRGYALTFVGIASGLSMVVLGTASSPTAAVLGASLAGGSQAVYMAISQTLVQQVVPDGMRGRVMSIYTMLAAGHMAMVNLLFGWLADSVGVRVLLIAPALVWLTVFLIVVLAVAELRFVLRRGDFRDRQPLPA
jgi:MFS family permease